MADKYSRLPDWIGARAGLSEKGTAAVAMTKAAMTKAAMTKATVADEARSKPQQRNNFICPPQPHPKAL
jgi:hypothetical protein